MKLKGHGYLRDQREQMVAGQRLVLEHQLSDVGEDEIWDVKLGEQLRSGLLEYLNNILNLQLTRRLTWRTSGNKWWRKKECCLLINCWKLNRTRRRGIRHDYG